MKKLVLCRPRGGLNDMLVQIEKCWRYAAQHDRILYIDSTKSGLLDSMDNYFLETKYVKFGNPNVTETSTFFPSEIYKLGLDYKVAWSSEYGNFTLKDTNNPIRFDFLNSYSEDILVHEQCGGGRESIEALKKLTLLPQIVGIINQINEELSPFESIHVRNTDYKTDYKSFFSSITLDPDSKIVLCTDDFGCQEYARSIWGDQLSIPNPAPKTDGKPLHMNPQLDRRSTNIAAITDLFLLALGKKLHYTKLDRGFISGFTRLALDLHSEPSLIKKILGVKP